MFFISIRNIDGFQVVENTFYVISELFYTKELLANITITQVELESEKYIKGYRIKK